MLHPTGDLGFYIHTAVQGIEGDDPTGTHNKLTPGKKQHPESKESERDEKRLAENLGEASRACK
jgi:hypothetical protein